MCISAIDKKHKRFMKHSAGNLIAALFFALFGGIYEKYSFGVYSDHMIYCFVPFLICGTLLLIIGIRDRVPDGRFILPLEMSALTFSVGSAAVGAIEIYGTTNKLTKLYPAAGCILFAAALAAYIADQKKLKARELTEA